MTDRAQIEGLRDAAARRFGPWTSHNIHLGHGVYTMRSGWSGTGPKIRRMLQLAQDLTGKPLADLRVLDLACAEGLYAIEFALHGAEAVGIEGRAEHVGRARAAAEALGLSRVTFLEQDVRDLDAARLGTFDVVLVLGILYHLDARSLLPFLRSVADVCRTATLVTTQVALHARASFEDGGTVYHGLPFLEHVPGATSQERRSAVWASLDNDVSFWLTRASLHNALADAGFTSVLTCEQPFDPLEFLDQPTLVALKGRAVDIRTQPEVEKAPPDRQPEKRARAVHPGQSGAYAAARRLAGSIPRPVKELLRWVAGVRHPRPGAIGQERDRASGR